MWQSTDMLHRTDFQYSTHRRKNQPTSSPHVTVSQHPVIATSANERAAINRKRSSIASSASNGYHSTGSDDGSSSDPSRARRRSGLPRAIHGQSGARLDAIVASKHSPGLTSEDTASLGRVVQPHNSRAARNQDDALDTRSIYREQVDAKRDVLGKPSRVDSGKGMRPIPRSSLDWGLDSSMGVAMTQKPRPARSAIIPPTESTSEAFEELPPRLIPELQALAASQARAGSAQPPSISSIGSPSTLFTNSPGTWSSRDTTPISISSYSPGIVSPPKTTPNGRRANTVPIPTASKTKEPKLPVLQETLHSSSSSMLSREPGVSDGPLGSTKKKKKNGLQKSPAPTPPPRTSSFRKQSRQDAEKAETGNQMVSPNYNVEAVSRKNQILLSRATSTGTESEAHPSSLPKSSQKPHHARHTVGKPAPGWPSRQDVVSFDPRKPTDTGANWPLQTHGKGDTVTRTGSQALSQGPLGAAHRDQENYTPRQKDLLEPAKPAQPLPDNPRPSASGSRYDASSPEVSTLAKPHPESRLGKWSNFSFFGRTAKSDRAKGNPPRKLQRRGPAAGTGHEGYGRFTRRGRKSSMDSSNAGSSTDRSESSAERLMSRFHSRRKSSSSKGDRSSQSDLDEFAAERLRPVVMLGGTSKPQAGKEIRSPETPKERDIVPAESTWIRANGRMSREYDVSRATSVGSAASIPAPTTLSQVAPMRQEAYDPMPALHQWERRTRRPAISWKGNQEG